MRSIKSIQAAKAAYIAVSILLCALGILLMLKPDLSLSAIGIIAGALLFAFGVVKLIGYFSKDLYRLAFQFDLALGILLIALGCVILFRPEHMMSFLCIVLGIAILADGLFKVQTALDARRFGLRSWWLILSLAILAGVTGAALVLRPAEGARVLAMLLGVSLLAEGILNLSVALCAVKVVRHQRPDGIEIDFE